MAPNMTIIAQAAPTRRKRAGKNGEASGDLSEADEIADGLRAHA